MASILGNNDEIEKLLEEGASVNALISSNLRSEREREGLKIHDHFVYLILFRILKGTV